ncbi:alpha/beta fold hydrolase [Jiella sonneratiae]|uniref:Alpha/beta hydrolase n=1 Tax=Jiella sonneratiae TaxID=2816856 RepID=A0ABS3J7V2_9HYPH|nr:alpha/beta hydrolase [Jiella sonneratiae]MBO0905750.1 alpha/beta hydrolase [Jiella sonneratiae]
MATSDGEPFFFEHGGLRLAGRAWGEIPGRAAAPLPLVCLPGLTRNSRDFAAFARHVRERDPARAVVAVDYRGRGLSEWAEDAEAYSVPAEAADTLAGLDHLGISRAVFVGTSRGTLVIHLIAAMRLDVIAGAVFNDAGPRLETAGLKLIRDTVGVTESFADWESAVDAVVAANAAGFPASPRADFERMARAGFVARDGRIHGDYDPALLLPLRTMDLDQPLPELWEAFDLLKAVPLLVIRGGHSALFSVETVAEMKTRHPNLAAIEIAGQGHAPFLETADLPERILHLAREADRAVPAHPPHPEVRR